MTSYNLADNLCCCQTLLPTGVIKLLGSCTNDFSQSLCSYIGSFVKAIKPGISKTTGEPDDLVNKAVVANVQYQIEKLKLNLTLLSQRLLDSKLKIVGDRYDLDTREAG